MFPNEFNYTLEKMGSPLKDRFGRQRLDRYGNPLTSVRIKQSPADKQRMIERLVSLAQCFNNDPGLFDFGAVTYGVDPVPMAPKRVFEDLLLQVVKWQQSPQNDILESFITRHNDILDRLKAIADINDPSGSSSAYLETEYGIRRINGNNVRIRSATQNNFNRLFTVKSGYGEMPAKSDHPGLDD